MMGGSDRRCGVRPSRVCGRRCDPTGWAWNV